MTDEKKPSRKARAIEAFLKALEDRPWRDIALAEIAEAAEMPLADLREAFPTRTAILRAFIARVDAAVLRAIAEDGDESEPHRERLFDVLMTRFEHLKPYRPALARVREHARRDAGFALKMGGQGLISAAWMLEAAGISSAPGRAGWRVAGLPYVWARAFEVFLKDDDPGLARTMATLDRQLRKAEARDRQIKGLRDRLKRACRGRRRRARAYDGFDEAGETFAREEGFIDPDPYGAGGRI
ncbi:MAG: TetR/AcrR family transcriptional regulator [Pseudomonadota bacterium]